MFKTQCKNYQSGDYVIAEYSRTKAANNRLDSDACPVNSPLQLSRQTTGAMLICESPPGSIRTGKDWSEAKRFRQGTISTRKPDQQTKATVKKVAGANPRSRRALSMSKRASEGVGTLGSAGRQIIFKAKKLDTGNVFS